MINQTSKSRLLTVKPDLQKIVNLAVSSLPFDVQIIEGVRSRARQKELYAQGRTTPGNVVTWTLDSKHITGDAIDIAPIENGVVLWNDKAKFDEIYKAMMKAAAEYGIGLRWGSDWDSDGVLREKGETDSPHFELTGVNRKWESKPLSESSLAPSGLVLPSSSKAETQQIVSETNKTSQGWLSRLLMLLKRK